MPLRDHFRGAVDKVMPWEGFHAFWPSEIVRQLRPLLPVGVRAEPGVHAGRQAEDDVLGFVTENWGAGAFDDLTTGGGTATMVETEPTLVIETEIDDADAFEVKVYDTNRARRLVAVIELISPGNKDRPDNRQTFVTKCAAYLQAGVSVCMVDLVTTRQFNLYAELLRFLGQPVPEVAGRPDELYAVELRPELRRKKRLRMQAWAHALRIGQPLPTLPLWLGDDQAILLDLEIGYEESCQTLELPPP